MAEHLEDHFKGVDGRSIYRQGWLPEGEPRAAAVLVHGLSEHGGRYAHVANRFTEAGIALYANDHRGHGRSEGGRANIDRMAHVVADLDTHAAIVRERHPGLPLVLVGHSLGGMVALQYATGSPPPFAALVLSAPAVDVSLVSSAERMIARIVAAVAPGLGMVKLEAEAVSRDPEVVRAYVEDPLVYTGKVPARTIVESLATADAIPDRCPRLELPLLVMHGTADRLVGEAGSRTVHERAASQDKTLKLYDGLYHEIFNEPEQAAVLDDVLAWLDERI